MIKDTQIQKDFKTLTNDQDEFELSDQKFPLQASNTRKMEKKYEIYGYSSVEGSKFNVQ